MTQSPLPDVDLSKLLDAIDIGFWEYDHVRDQMRYSALLRSWLGDEFPEGESATLAEWLARIHADDRQQAEASVRISVETNAPFRLEYRFVRADGNWIWLLAQGYVAERDAQGRPLRSMGSKVEITQRKQQEQLLRLQQDFSQVLLSNPDHAGLQSAVLETVLGLPELDGGGLYAMRPDGGYSLIASGGISTQFLAQASEVDPGSPRALMLQTGRAICSCRESNSSCTNDDLIWHPDIHAEGITALMIFPIAVSGRISASLNLASRHVRSMPSQIVDFLQSIARQFGQALERLQAQEDALQQRNNLDGFFRAISDYIFVLDSESRIQYVNPAVKMHLGYGESLLGQSVLAVHPPRVHAEALRVVGDMLAGRRESCPLPLLRADGSEILVDTRIVQGIWNGQPALLGISRDISELKAAQDELVKRDLYQRAVLDNFPFLVWLKDQDSRFLAVNAPFAQACGAASSDELAGKSDFDIWPPDLAETYRADDRAVLGSGISKTAEESLEASTGRNWIETYKSPVILGGKVIGTVGYARDITEMIQAREHLAERESTLRATLNATTDGILVIGSAGQVLSANRRFQELWRISDAILESGVDDQLLACVLDQLLDPQTFIAEVQRLYGSAATSFDILRFKDGRIFERYSEALRLGEHRARVWSFHDVTKREHALEQLRAERDLFVGGPVAVLIWLNAPGWPLEYASPNVGSVYGYSADAMLARGFDYSQCIHPDDLARVADEVTRYLADGDRKNWEQRYRIVLPDGTVRWVYDFSVAERDSQGQATRMHGYVMDETAVHESARDLGKTKEQLQFAIQGSGVGLWDWEVQTGRSQFDERWATIVGYTLAELEPISIETWFRFVHPEDRERSEIALAAHFRGESERYICESRVLHKAGHWVWVLDQGQVVEWSGNDPATRVPLRMVGTHLDISQQKQLQEALEHERGFLKTLIQTIPDLVWLKDPNGVYLACNPRFEQLYGNTEAVIVGKCDYDFVDAELADFFRANDLAAMTAGHSRVNEEWLDFADGSPGALFETTKTPMRAADGTLIGVLGIAHDITVARAAENALRVAGERRRQLMDISRDGIAIISQEHQVIEANTRFAEMLGYSETEILELHTWDWEANLSEADVRANFADLSRINLTFETRHRRRDGTLFDAEVSATGANLDGVNVVITVNRDISERKAAEQALRESENALNLAQQVAQIGSWRLEIESRKLSWSDQTYRIFGLPVDTPLTLELFLSRIHPDDLEALLKAWNAALHGAPYEIEHRIQSDHGEQWVREKAQITFAEGKPQFCVGTVQNITERRQAKMALAQSEERYRILADYSTDWQYWLGTDGRYIYVSPGCESITGYLPQAFDADPDLMNKIMYPDDLWIWKKHWDELPSSQLAHARMEFRIVARDGSTRWIEHQCQAVNSSNTKYQGRRGVNRDITERKQAEISLRMERDRSQRYLDTIEAVIIALDQAGRITLINRKGCELFGYQAEELLGEIWFDRCLPQPNGMAQVYPVFQAIIAGNIEPAEYYENAVLTRVGQQRLIAWHNSVIRNADGQIVGTLSAGEDVTERRAAERALAESSLFLRESQSIARVGGWKANPESNILVWSDEIYRLCEHPLDQAPRLDEGLNYFAAEFRSLIVASLQAAWNTGQAFRLECEIQLLSGRRFWAELRCIGRVEDTEGAYLAGTFQDISERKAIQRELEQHREHLEALVAQRTSELVSARMRAEEASRSKSTFLANMSHEIRTPMNAIIGLNHLLRRAATDPKQIDHLDKVNDAARHLLGIINDILDISKIEAGKMVMEVADFHLDQVISNTLDLIREKAASKSLALLSEIDSALPCCLRGDAMRLGQVLLNFASNALKFTEQGSICISASLIERNDSLLNVRFEVIDTGIGISAEQIGRLFHAFEQADTSTTRKFGGTGLGLTISKRLISLMGGHDDGEIGVASKLGEGSRFWFEIPLSLGTDTENAVHEVSRDVMAKLSSRRGARILLAEDNEVNQEVALELLRDANLTADVAADGATALLMVQDAVYDLILMDVQMPIMDGLAATRAIRTLPGREQIPILAMTANAFAEDRQQCLAAGMNDHVAKPVDPDALYGALIKWLPERNAAPKATVAPVSNLAAPLSDQDHAALRAINGLDVNAGVNRIRGNWSSYERLLRLYADSHQNDMLQLRECLKQGNTEEARRIAHSLKGASGALGAVSVQSLSAELEAAIRQASPQSEIVQLSEQLEAVLVRLVANLNGALPKTETRSADTASRTAVLRLEQLLREDDMRAGDALRDALPALQMPADALARLSRQIETFDFESALETLHKANK